MMLSITDVLILLMATISHSSKLRLIQKTKEIPKFDVNAHCERMAHLLEGIAKGEKIEINLMDVCAHCFIYALP